MPPEALVKVAIGVSLLANAVLDVGGPAALVHRAVGGPEGAVALATQVAGGMGGSPGALRKRCTRAAERTATMPGPARSQNAGCEPPGACRRLCAGTARCQVPHSHACGCTFSHAPAPAGSRAATPPGTARHWATCTCCDGKQAVAAEECNSTTQPAASRAHVLPGGSCAISAAATVQLAGGPEAGRRLTPSRASGPPPTSPRTRCRPPKCRCPRPPAVGQCGGCGGVERQAGGAHSPHHRTAAPRLAPLRGHHYPSPHLVLAPAAPVALAVLKAQLLPLNALQLVRLQVALVTQELHCAAALFPRRWSASRSVPGTRQPLQCSAAARAITQDGDQATLSGVLRIPGRALRAQTPGLGAATRAGNRECCCVGAVLNSFRSALRHPGSNIVHFYLKSELIAVT